MESRFELEAKVREKYLLLAMKRFAAGKKLTYVEMAKATGVTQPTFSKWLSGTHIPGYETLVKVNNYLDTELEKYDA